MSSNSPQSSLSSLHEGTSENASELRISVEALLMHATGASPTSKSPQEDETSSHCTTENAKADLPYDTDLMTCLLAVLQRQLNDGSSNYNTDQLTLTPDIISALPLATKSDDPTALSSLNDSWPALNDILATLLTSSNENQSAVNSTTASLLGSTLSDVLSELPISSNQDTTSMLSNLSSSFATAGSAVHRGPDLPGILSASGSASRAGTSGLSTPKSSSDYQPCKESTIGLSMPAVIQDHHFGSISPSPNSREFSGSGTPTATAEELFESFSGAGDQTPSGSTCRTFSDAPRSLLFHLDGSLNLEFFKVYPCKNESHVHDRKNCPFYHSQRDRRRQPLTYNAEQCEDHFDLEGDFSCACPNDDACDKCHNRHELLYHPDIYKQRFCSSYNHLEVSAQFQCHRGRFCAFAHTRDEIRCDLFSEEEERIPKSDFFMKMFKTLWCPYGVQHDWHGCLYAHTYQDCRRSPSIGYGSEPCPYWQKDLHSADYQKRCPFGPRCPYSHGSKEQLYHPAYYKTMPCADYKTKRTCPRSDLCAFYHDISEKRPAVPLSSSTTPPTAEILQDESSSFKLYDYTRPIPTNLMILLQPNFMRPPLFNLDDFEAFGHASRVGSGRRESNPSTYRSGQSSPHYSSNRPFAGASSCPDSPSYPSIYQDSGPYNRYPMYPIHNNDSGQYGTQHPSYSRQNRQQFMSNSPQGMSSPYRHSGMQQNDGSQYSDSFSSRRQLVRQQRGVTTSPMPMSAQRMRLGYKDGMGGRFRERRGPSDNATKLLSENVMAGRLF